MPFDDTKPRGLILSLALQSAAGYSFMLTMMSIIQFHLGVYFYNVAFLRDFQSLFDRIDLKTIHWKTSITMDMVNVVKFHERYTRCAPLIVQQNSLSRTIYIYKYSAVISD